MYIEGTFDDEEKTHQLVFPSIFPLFDTQTNQYKSVKFQDR